MERNLTRRDVKMQDTVYPMEIGETVAHQVLLQIIADLREKMDMPRNPGLSTQLAIPHKDYSPHTVGT